MPEWVRGRADRLGVCGILALALALTLAACGQVAPPVRLIAGAAPLDGADADVTGAVVGLDAATVLLRPDGGAAITVATGPATAVFALAPGMALDLAAGDRVVIQGDQSGDGAYTARSLADLGPAQDGDQGPPAAAGGVTGVISAVVGDVVTVRTPDGAWVTVLLGADAAIRVERPGAVGDLRLGDTVAVWGAATGPTTYLARTIVDRGAPAPLMSDERRATRMSDE